MILLYSVVWYLSGLLTFLYMTKDDDITVADLVSMVLLSCLGGFVLFVTLLVVLASSDIWNKVIIKRNND